MNNNGTETNLVVNLWVVSVFSLATIAHLTLLGHVHVR